MSWTIEREGRVAVVTMKPGGGHRLVRAIPHHESQTVCISETPDHRDQWAGLRVPVFGAAAQAPPDSNHGKPGTRLDRGVERGSRYRTSRPTSGEPLVKLTLVASALVPFTELGSLL